MIPKLKFFLVLAQVEAQGTQLLFLEKVVERFNHYTLSIQSGDLSDHLTSNNQFDCFFLFIMQIKITLNGYQKNKRMAIYSFPDLFSRLLCWMVAMWVGATILLIYYTISSKCMLVKQYSTYLIINNTFQRTTPNISCFAMFEQVGFIERLLFKRLKPAWENFYSN